MKFHLTKARCARHAGFERLQARFEGFDLAFEVRGDILPFARQLEQGIQIGGEARDLLGVGDGLLQPLPVLHYLLRFFGLVPEIRIGNLFLGFG